ncbi:MAG: tetratricopeptide repeat protein [Brevinematia bacterium]
MEIITKVINTVYSFVVSRWQYFVAGGVVVVLVFIGVLVYFSIQSAEENSLKTKFDLAYFSYINSQKDTNTLEQNFQNFLSTLQSISDTGKNYKIVAIANIILGDIYYNQGRSFDTAISYYSKATNAPSQFLRVVAIFNIAQTYEAMGLFEEALKNYEVIFKNYPNSFLAPVSIVKSSEVFYYIGNFDKAREMYSLATNKYPDSYANTINDLLGLVINQVK